MAQRKISLVPGEFYHIFNRGNSKQLIFLDDKDREHFIYLLYLCNSTNNFRFRDDIIRAKITPWDFKRGELLVAVGSWVLMPNHFHLYLTTPCTYQVCAETKSNISLFVERLTKAYSKYFNTKYSRTGSLFESKFKSVHLSNDVQAKYLFSYIHLNPVKLVQKDWKEKGIKDKNKVLNYLRSYKWSSYQDFLEIKRKENLILDRENFINFFKNKNSFEKEIFDWLNYKEDVF